MSHAIKAAFGLGILILGVALFTPALIDATNGDATDTLSLSNQTDSELTERLSVALTEVNENTDPTPDNATVEYTDNTSFATNFTTLDVGNESTIVLSGDNLTTGLESVDGDTAQFNVSYPPMFGWDDAPRTFFENAGLILALFGGAVVIVSIVVVFGDD